MRNPEYIVIYEVVCPACGDVHHLYGWHPSYCPNPNCKKDLGGKSKHTLQAKEHRFKMSANQLTGQPVFQAEAV